LRESEERLELALSGAGRCIIDWDLEQDRIVFNPIFRRCSGMAMNFNGPAVNYWNWCIPTTARRDAAFRELLAGAPFPFDLQSGSERAG
jgi:PAS domain-containing protein